MPGLERRELHLLDADGKRSGERIAVRHVMLHRALDTERGRAELIAELEAIVREGLEIEPAGSTGSAGEAA